MARTLQEEEKNDPNGAIKLENANVDLENFVEDAALDARVNLKFDLHILPWLFGIWLFSFIDRSNIGNARIAGLATDLSIATGTSFNVALLVFYIPYILVDVPSNLLVKKLRAGIYLPSLITGWGVVCMCMGFITNFAGLVACRLLLGLFEGGILGGVIIYLAMFYRRHDMMLRNGLFYCAAPLSGAFGGLLASGLAKIEVGRYRRWPWIFFIEGAMTVVFGIICFFFMPDTPAAAGFLTDEEKEWALLRMRIDAGGSSSATAVEEEKFSWHYAKTALLAPQTYFCSFIWFFLLVPLYSFTLFLPSIISGMGYTSTTAQLFTVPPNMAAFLTVIITAYYSDKVKNRGYFIIAGSILGICGYVMLLVAKTNAVRYAGTFLVAIGVFQGSPMIMGWISNNVSPHYVRAVAVGTVISIANCSAFIGTFIYLQRDAPRYILGHAVSLGALVLTVILATAQVFYLQWENKKRDKGERDHRLLEEDEGKLGEKPGYPLLTVAWYRNDDEAGNHTPMTFSKENFVQGFSITCGEYYILRDELTPLLWKDGLYKKKFNSPNINYDYLWPIFKTLNKHTLLRYLAHVGWRLQMLFRWITVVAEWLKQLEKKEKDIKTFPFLPQDNWNWGDVSLSPKKRAAYFLYKHITIRLTNDKEEVAIVRVQELQPKDKQPPMGNMQGLDIENVSLSYLSNTLINNSLFTYLHHTHNITFMHQLVGNKNITITNDKELRYAVKLLRIWVATKIEMRVVKKG